MNRRLISLDIARAISALVVLWAHLCGFLYSPLQDRTNASLLDKVLDASSGYGHQAVVIFFVLSGFLVSRSIIDGRDEWFDWRRYFSARLSRLWVVLVPSLFMTLLINSFGLMHDVSGYYAGLLQADYGGQRGTPVELDALTFFGNILFLQNIYVSNYGDNEALWSLAYEFWYYVIFPLGWRAVFSHSLKERAFVGLLLLLIILFLPAKILLYGVIWLIGVLCVPLRKIWRQIDVPRFLTGGVFPVVLVAGALQATHSLNIPPFFKDLLLAACFSLIVLNAEFVVPERTGIIQRFFVVLSDFSYSLYATHFSALALVIVFCFGSEFIERSIGNLWVGLLVAGSVVLYSYIFHIIFERRTSDFRGLLDRVMRAHC